MAKKPRISSRYCGLCFRGHQKQRKYFEEDLEREVLSGKI